MSNAQKSKSQHYVPRFYLRHWENGGGLWAYDKMNGKSFKTGVAGIAAGNRFYDLAPGVVQGGVAEDFNERDLGEGMTHAFEREQRVVLNWLRKYAAYGGIPLAFRRTIAFSLALQYIRTPAFREQLTQGAHCSMGSHLRDLVLLNYSEKEADLVSAEVNSDVFAVHHLLAMGNVALWKTISEPMVGHAWIFGIATSAECFITSDNPVSRRPHLGERNRTSCGFASYGIEVAYPVTPTKLVVIAEREFHRGLRRLDGRAIPMQPWNVRYYNRVIAANCDRFLFSVEDDFSDVDRFFEGNPELRKRRWDKWVSESGELITHPDGTIRQRTERFIRPLEINWLA